jgi:hypothetical protein
MADTLTEKVRGVAAFLAQVRGYNVDVLLEAAAELDRREAIVAAAEAEAAAIHAYREGKVPLVDLRTAQDALLAALKG